MVLGKKPMPWVNAPSMVGVSMVIAAILYYTITYIYPYERSILSHPTAKLISGGFLLAWMTMLWKMFSVREGKDKADVRFWNRRRHELLGATVPLPFFLHAETPGYGMVFLLSCVLVGTLIVGFFNPHMLRKTFPERSFLGKSTFRSGWLVAHIFLSTVLLGLIGLHIYTAIWYH